MKRIVTILGIFILLLSISISCKSASKTTDNKPTSVVAQHNGPQLWANNCARCHNSPSPDAYSDHEWIAIVNHMQKVAGLTVSDADQVLEFMKASN